MADSERGSVETSSEIHVVRARDSVAPMYNPVFFRSEKTCACAGSKTDVKWLGEGDSCAMNSVDGKNIRFVRCRAFGSSLHCVAYFAATLTPSDMETDDRGKVH